MTDPNTHQHGHGDGTDAHGEHRAVATSEHAQQADAHAGHGLQVGSHGGAQVHGHGASLLKVVLNEISLWRLMNKREQLSNM